METEGIDITQKGMDAIENRPEGSDILLNVIPSCICCGEDMSEVMKPAGSFAWRPRWECPKCHMQIMLTVMNDPLRIAFDEWGKNRKTPTKKE